MSEVKRIRALVTNQGELIKIGKSDNESQTQKLPQDLFGEHYRSGKVARPPYNPQELIELLEMNTYHFKCIKQKALDTVGSYSVVEADEEKNKKSDKKGKKEKVSEKGRQQILDFIENCHPILSFYQITKALMMDFESVGWFVLEVIRNRGGEIIGVNHIPAHTCRFLLDGTGILHRRNNKERIFKFFGDKEARIDPNTGQPCNEVIFRFDYTPRNDYYGIPDYIPAVGSMLANIEIRDYNIKFFENGAIPQYAVVLKGGELDEGTEEVIKSHFRDNIKGSQNSHKTLVISAPEGGEIEFHPLAVDVKDGHFRLYRMDNRDEIIHAHGVPPYRIGIAETGALGGNVAEEMTQIYKESVINPRQTMMEEVFSKIFTNEKFGTNGVQDWKLEFDEINTDNEKLEAEIKEIRVRTAKTAKEAGVHTPDELREMAGDTPFEDMDDVEDDIKEWANTPIGFQSPQEEETPPDDQIDQGGQNNASEGELNDSEGVSNNIDQYQNILNDYRKEKNSVQKMFDNVKKAFKVEGERVWEEVRKSMNAKDGLVEILKSKLGFRSKPKKVVGSESEIEDTFKARLKLMFEKMKDRVQDKLPEMDLSVFSKIEKADSYENMLDSDEFAQLYPQIWSQVYGIMNPTDLSEIMYEMMVSGIEFGCADMLSQVRGYEKNISWNLFDKNVSKFLDNYVFKASQKTMNRLTGDVIKQIKIGQENGYSIEQIMGLVNQSFVGMTAYETERIARTETIKSSNAGRFETLQQSGVEKKVWIGRDDGRERESHIALNYEIKNIDEPFSNGLMYPGDPEGKPEEVINCRCTIGAIFTENEKEYADKYNKK